MSFEDRRATSALRLRPLQPYVLLCCGPSASASDNDTYIPAEIPFISVNQLFLRIKISFSSLFVKVISLAVNNNNKRHILNIELSQRLCTEIFVCDKLSFLYTFCKESSRAANGSEINATILFMASTTSGRRAPFPIIPRAPTDIIVGAYASIRPLVVGPALPIT